MAWKAELLNKKKQGGNIVALLRLSQGDEVIDAPLIQDVLSNEYVAKIVAQKIALLAVRDVAFDALVEGDVTPHVPTQEEIDREAFFVIYRKFQTDQKAVENGLKKSDDQDVIDTIVAMKAAFRDEYQKDPRW